MRRFHTLHGRLTALALVAVTIAVALVVVAFNLVLSSALRGDVDSRLRSQAAAAATTVEADGGSLAVRESPNDEAIDSQIWVYDTRRTLLRPPAPATVQRAADALAGRSHAFADVASPEVRLYALALTEGGRRVGTVVAARSLAAYDRTTDYALVGTLVLAALVLAAVFAVTWLTIGRALRPVTEMTRSAADWSERDLDRRFGPAPRPDELGELARTFDALLDRLAAGLRHEQRLSAELSHELRTPLARIVAEIELLQRRERSTEDRSDAYEVVARSAEQMSRILETLMAAARAESQPERGRSDLVDVLATVSEQWTEPFAERGLRLTVHSGDAPQRVGVDAEVVERVIAPLLDNARRYARSDVTVDTLRAGGRVRIEVRDDGPGVAAEDAERVFEPGVRGGRLNGHGGAGLGLPLARRLARAAGGEVSAEPGVRGSTKFVVELPA
jgi:signal transduction histidine kinase